MAKQTINIGTSANSKDGDIIRDAFNKVNQNFNELYAKDTTDFDGSYNSLTNTPTIPADVSDLTDTQGLIGQTDRLVSGENELVFGGEIDPAALTWPDGSWQSTAFVGDATRLYGNLDQDVNVTVNSVPTVTATTTAGAGGPFTGQFEISEPFDILEVQAGWEMNTGTEQSPIWTTVTNAVLNPGEYWINLASGFEFEFAPSTAYTFRSPTQVQQTWTFGTDGSLTLPGELHGTPDVGGTTINITPATAANNKKFGFRIDQIGEPFSRAFLDMPSAENDKAVSLTFNHTNNTTGYIFNQGTDSAATQLNNAFNILYNSGDIKLSAQGAGSVIHTWTFGNDGSLTFPDGTSQSTAGGGGSTLVNGAYTVSLESDGKLTAPGNITSKTLTVSNGSAGYEYQLFVNDVNGRILFRNYNNRQGVAGYDYSTYNTGIVVDTGSDGYTVVSGENSGSSSITSFTFDFRKLANGTSAERMGVLRFDSGIDNGPSLSNAVSMKFFPTTNAESNGTYYEFATTGLRFPNATVQTTAWAGGRVVAVPAHSTGADGDQQGDLAFNSTHLYYCTADYNQLGHQVTGADYLGRASLNTNAFQLTKTADTIQITVGDIISDSDGGATSTVVTVSSDENYTYVSTGGLAYAGVFPFTFTSTDYVSGGNIWKRVAWGGDTW